MSKVGFILIMVFFSISLMLIAAIISLQSLKREEEIIEEIERLVSGTTWYSPEEFLELRAKKSVFNRRSRISSDYNVLGVYIIHNSSEDMHYVGQSKKVLDRAASHFMGRGNGDVYADYKYGRKFKISFILLEDSQYHSLNELEKDAIFTFEAYNKGYNRTKGNRSRY